ncbi:MAG: DUF6624 domain-containing protein [Pseudomonadota bacterium]
MTRRIRLSALISVCGISAAVFCGIASAAPTDSFDLPTTPEAAIAFDYCSRIDALADFERESLIDKMADRSGATLAGDRATAILIDAGLAVSRNSRNARQCNSAFKKGARLYDKRLAKRLRERGGKQLPDATSADTVEGLKSELRRLWVLDQAARVAYLDLRTDVTESAEFWAFRLSVANAVMIDGESGEFIKRALRQYDWIDIQRFGEAASQRAWLLVQHADTDVAFQALALERMEPYLATGGVSKRNYAFLWDRVAVNQDRLQRFGTQPAYPCVDGKIAPAPMEDPDQVDNRRAAMGLEPLDEHMAQMSQTRC